MKKSTIYKANLLIICLLSVAAAHSQEAVYRCEYGLQGGIGYYVGELSPHIFMRPREVAGMQFRYKFTPRWALQAKAQYQRLSFRPPQAAQDYSNRLVNIDVTGEFNFFRFGIRQYDKRVKPLTPYIFLGIGAGVYNDVSRVGVYLPFGFGLKWKFAPRWGLNLAWQQQLYFTDGLEGRDEYGNTWNLNGSDFLNNDLVSTLTLGIVFEFVRQRSACRTCQY